MDVVREAARRRNQAEELRAKAELMAHPETRAQYIRMAEAYEALADSQEAVARLRPRE